MVPLRLRHVSFFIVVAVIFVIVWLNNHIELTTRKSNVIGSLTPSIIFYNRIPKTGSTTLTNAIAYDLSELNGFHAIHLNLTKNRFVMNLVDQGILIRNMSTWTSVHPAFYHGHIVFIDFTRFGYKNPVYINMVREPLDRLLSHYYFLRFGDNYRVGLKRSRSGNNETFDDCLRNNGNDCDPKQLWLQIPYFCGSAAFCSEVGNERALEMAKWNLMNRYLLVGLTERMTDMIRMLEQLLPDFFKGSFEHFQSLSATRQNLRSTKKKIRPNDETIARMKRNEIYLMELEFYKFAATEFDNRFRRSFSGGEMDGMPAVLKNQFHYEKIRPSL